MCVRVFHRRRRQCVNRIKSHYLTTESSHCSVQVLYDALEMPSNTKRHEIFPIEHVMPRSALHIV